VIVSIAVVMVVAPIVVPAVLAAVMIIAVEAPLLLMMAVFLMTPEIVVITEAVVITEIVSIHVAIARHVYPVVPIITHEIHAPCASVVFGTVVGPVPLVSGAHTQIDRRCRITRTRCDNHGLGIDDRWRRGQITDAQLSVETRLTDSYGHDTWASDDRRTGYGDRQ